MKCRLAAGRDMANAVNHTTQTTKSLTSRPQDATVSTGELKTYTQVRDGKDRQQRHTHRVLLHLAGGRVRDVVCELRVDHFAGVIEANILNE